MQKYENFSNVLDSVLKKFDNDWNYGPDKLEDWITQNLRLIVGQTQNIRNAKDLRNRLLKLSDKINIKFNTPYAHNLAFEIMGIAQGIFSKEDAKINFTSLLPTEIRQKIYAEVMATRPDKINSPITSGFKTVSLFYKIDAKIAEETKVAWINKEQISLTTLKKKYCCCKTVPDAIKFIKNNQNLYYVSFPFTAITDNDIKELQDCTWIQHLSINSDQITDEGLKFIKRMPLQTAEFVGCSLLTDKAIENLKGMLIRTINFTACKLLTNASLEYLKELPLQSINFTGTKVTFEALQNFKQHFISRGVKLKIC